MANLEIHHSRRFQTHTRSEPTANFFAIFKAVASGFSNYFCLCLVSRKETLPLPAKIRTIHWHSWPINVKQLRKFLDMLSFYARFTPRIARVQGQMSEILRGKMKKKSAINWIYESTAGFGTSKRHWNRLRCLCIRNSGCLWPKYEAHMTRNCN